MEKIRKSIKLDWIIIGATAFSFFATIFIYPTLPAQIPYHWSIDGSIKAAGKWIVFITALLPIVIYYMVKLRSKKNQTQMTRVGVSLLSAIIHWVIIFIAKGMTGNNVNASFN